MKFSAILFSLLCFTNPIMAQTFTHPYGAIPGPNLIVTEEVLKGETFVAVQEAQYADDLSNLETQISELQGYQDELNEKIPKIKTSRDLHNRNDGCLNTLSKGKEICVGPFSNDPQAKYNYDKARELHVELISAKAKADAVSKRLRELEKQAKPLRKKKEKLAEQQVAEEARIQREIATRTKQETKSREAEIKKEQEILKAQELLGQRKEKKLSSEITDLRNQIKRRDVQSALSDLRLKQNQAGEALRIIEEEYDRSLMGAYMQKKFAELLDSDLLCKKTAECQSGKKTKVSQEELLKLFPNAPGAAKGSSSGSGTGTR